MDRGSQADEDRIGDEEMADVELDDPRECRDLPHGVVIKTMPRMTFDAERRGCLGRALQAREFSRGANCVALSRGIAPGAGVQLDNRRADRKRGFDRLWFRLDEKRNDDTGTAPIRH